MSQVWELTSRKKPGEQRETILVNSGKHHVYESDYGGIFSVVTDINMHHADSIYGLPSWC